MAIFRQSVQTLSRSAGRSAVAAAAYRAAERLVCERRGTTHDFRRKRGVSFAAIIAPDGGHLDRERLWNSVEAAETRVNSVVAREWTIALPHELGEAERRDLAMKFVGVLIERYKFVVDIAIHDPSEEPQRQRDDDIDREPGLEAGPDPRNYHAHILTSTREYVGDYKFGAKIRQLDGKKSGAAEVVTLREIWAGLCNDALEAAGSDARVDHRSNAVRGILQGSTGKLGLAAVSIERRTGTRSDRRIYLEEQKAEIEAQFAQAKSQLEGPLSDSAPTVADEGNVPTRPVALSRVVRRKGVDEADGALASRPGSERRRATTGLSRRGSRRFQPMIGDRAVGHLQSKMPTSLPGGSLPLNLEITASNASVRPIPGDTQVALAAVREALATLRHQSIARDAKELDDRLRSYAAKDSVISSGASTAQNLMSLPERADISAKIMPPKNGTHSARLAGQGVNTNSAGEEKPAWGQAANHAKAPRSSERFIDLGVPARKTPKRVAKTEISGITDIVRGASGAITKAPTAGLSPTVPIPNSNVSLRVQRTESLTSRYAYRPPKTEKDVTAEAWIVDHRAGSDVAAPRQKASRPSLRMWSSLPRPVDTFDWSNDDLLGIHAVGLALMAVELSHDPSSSVNPVDVVRRLARVVANAIGVAEHKLVRLADRIFAWIGSAAEHRADENRNGAARAYGIWLSRWVHHAKTNGPGPVDFTKIHKLTRANEEALMALADRFANAVELKTQKARHDATDRSASELPAKGPLLAHVTAQVRDKRQPKGSKTPKRGGSGLNE